MYPLPVKPDYTVISGHAVKEESRKNPCLLFLPNRLNMGPGTSPESWACLAIHVH